MPLSANIVCIEVSFTNIHKTYVGGYKMVKKTILALGALAVTVLMTACGRADGSGNTAAQDWGFHWYGRSPTSTAAPFG